MVVIFVTSLFFFTRYTTNMFTSEVHKESSYRRQVDENKWRVVNVVRRFAALPFALLYGAAMYFLLRCVFFDVRTKQTHRNTSLPQESKGLKVIAKVDVEWGDVRIDIIGICIGYTFILALISIFSRTFRCLLLLMFPCLVTGRNRIALFTFITGLLFDRPLTRIARNLNTLLENTSETKPVPELVSGYLYIVGVCLMLVSVGVLMVDATSYMRSYYSDNSFDNTNITSNIKHIWKTKQHPAVLPLRHWEVNKGYETSVLDQ